MKKVLTMTLNPCIDKTIYFDSFTVGATNIVKRVVEEAAGKGINVAVGLQHLNVPVKALGFAYKDDAFKLYEKLTQENIPYSFVEVDGRLRVNQKLFDESKSEMTECNERGCPVSESDIQQLFKLLENELKEASILVLSGSVPPEVPTDIYKTMSEMANCAGVKVILDASGELLKEGLKGKPYLIKPNWEEFVKTFGENNDTIVKELLSQDISYICLSLGAEGAVLFSQNSYEISIPMEENESENSISVEKRPAISVPIRSLQGAGDAMVAGLCKAIFESRESDMLENALTMAASTIMLEGTQMGNGNII